jgi:hypothetical protein
MNFRRTAMAVVHAVLAVAADVILATSGAPRARAISE